MSPSAAFLGRQDSTAIPSRAISHSFQPLVAFLSDVHDANLKPPPKTKSSYHLAASRLASTIREVDSRRLPRRRDQKPRNGNKYPSDIWFDLNPHDSIRIAEKSNRPHTLDHNIRTGRKIWAGAGSPLRYGQILGNLSSRHFL